MKRTQAPPPPLHPNHHSPKALPTLCHGRILHSVCCDHLTNMCCSPQSRQLDDEAALASAKRMSLASGSLPAVHGLAEALSFKYWDSDWSVSASRS